MADEARVAFLKWCLPQLGLRWPGYRKVRRLVGKRINRRLAELGLADLSEYRTFLTDHSEEWAQLDALCRIPISRFYRDRAVFDAISRELLPQAAALATARGDDTVSCWCAGCAAGEEPYTLAMAWRLCVAPNWPAVTFTVVATDAEEVMIERARAACYSHSSLKDLPPAWLEAAFIRRGPLFCLATEFRKDIRFELQDIRQSMPAGPFDLILCRNLVFTYFDTAAQRHFAQQVRNHLRPGGWLVLGSHETLPLDSRGFTRPEAGLAIYRHEPRNR